MTYIYMIYVYVEFVKTEILKCVLFTSVAPSCRKLGLDLALVADKTESLGQEHFEKMKNFLMKLVTELDVSKKRTHVAVITYHRKPTVLNDFTKESSYNKQDLLNLIDNIPDKLSSPTRTDLGLLAAEEKLFTADGGDRPEVPNVLVLFTDGKTHEGSKPYDEIIPLLKVS